MGIEARSSAPVRIISPLSWLPTSASLPIQWIERNARRNIDVTNENVHSLRITSTLTARVLIENKVYASRYL